MYFIFVTNDVLATQLFEGVLCEVDPKKNLIVVPNGYELIQFLQNVKKGESYPELIILTPKFLRISGTDVLELLKTDDIYRLIPVIMLLPENNEVHEAVCKRLGTEFIPDPKNQIEWMSAVNKMCAAYS